MNTEQPADQEPTPPPDSVASDSDQTEQTADFAGAPLSNAQDRLSRRQLWRILRWFVLLILVAVVGAAGGGYLSGNRQREQRQAQDIQGLIQEQFALGLIDLENERFELARQRFEYIIKLDPSFPQAPERLAEALLGMREPLPTFTPPPASPTPNLDPVEDIISDAQQAFQAAEWTRCIELLLTLRAKDSDYRTVEVDGLLFASLRERGLQRISQEKLLEEGMYDLSLAESFAPLDLDAENWRSWSQLYLTANSYFGLNWEQASFYFGLVYSVAPGIKNDVIWKYALAEQMFADQLVAGADPCAAPEHYEISLSVQDNEILYPTATRSVELCLTATAPPTSPPEPESSPTPDTVGPTATQGGPPPGPTEIPSPPGVVPTDTP